MRIHVEAVHFVERHGTAREGTATFATVEHAAGFAAIVSVGVEYQRDGDHVMLAVPAHALSRDSYVRVCEAAGIDLQSS